MNIPSILLRGFTGAFILQSGLGKRGMDVEGYKGLQEMAATGIPKLGELDPEDFGAFITYSEIGIGSALLCPVVPNKLAGAALGAFSAGMLSMYFGNPAMTQDDGIRPSQEGTPLAKDGFMAAIAAALFFLPGKKKSLGDKLKAKLGK
ncbi:hypothetical protein ACUY3K_08115 [Corynebacterium uberis]|uniref:hypothetical protein n=1 Tax=Corynebacterium TaxID=1716 RepID=UPI001D0BB747|nr:MULTISPECIES: hypothetical protein [Corynebacterium]MCZ9310116.1 hypothetical protein [Corynebacterium sp. c6VSa_13]UDL73260.1 hypothetical protein LH391_09195 [Corynebacterium uberis]UDL75863.1 hypothetical protein LH393_00195 [Corynebacterium uberis]UDL78075.1 hypothetical protein LH394_00190 [Corynebacterium uberis]UDL80358.1 hypothetical protein LH392_00620 [Corynebacterium uberis]